jgi:hypothetical protein
MVSCYSFKVKTGVRLVDIGMKKHVPSHIKIEGHHALISYEGQPMTCFRCNEQGHQIHECPRRRMPVSRQTNYDVNTWANVVKRVTNNGISATSNGTINVPTPLNE